MFAEYSVGYFASHDEGWGEVGGASRSLLCRTLDPLLCLRTPADKEKVFRENGTTNIKNIQISIFGTLSIFSPGRLGAGLDESWLATERALCSGRLAPHCAPLWSHLGDENLKIGRRFKE